MDKRRKRNRMGITFNYSFIELFVTNCTENRVILISVFTACPNM